MSHVQIHDMMSTVPRKYEELASRSLMSSSTPMPLHGTQLLAHHLLDDKERDRLKTLPDIDLAQLDLATTRTRKRLVAHCRGLLHLQCRDSGPISSSAVSYKNLPIVCFAHRSIGEYLQGERHFLLQKSNSKQPAITYIFKAHICQRQALILVNGSELNPSMDGSKSTVVHLYEVTFFHNCLRLFLIIRVGEQRNPNCSTGHNFSGP
jgi:hypothetical protein